MKIHLIWAQAKDRVIGWRGSMPWHVPEDLAHFKRTTNGHPVIMGRKTWDSLPPKFRPLPGRLNVVISSDVSTRENLKEKGCLPMQNLLDALSFCEQEKMPEVWVMGGAQIYAQALPFAHTVVVTQIDAEYEGDAFAPRLDASWHETTRETHTAANGLKFAFVHFARV